MAGLKKKLAQVGQEALERLELPVNIAAGVARIELLGNRELYMDRHRGVLAYTTEAVDVNGGGVVVRVRGQGLQLLGDDGAGAADHRKNIRHRSGGVRGAPCTVKQ